MLWSRQIAIIDKVYKHVWGHSNFYNIKNVYDIMNLLQEHKIGNDESKTYLVRVFHTCVAYHAAQLSARRRAASHNHFSRGFNCRVFIDLFLLDDLQLLHCVDAVLKISLIAAVNSLTLREALSAFKQSWIRHFWVSESLQGDVAFQKNEFFDYIKSIGRKFGTSLFYRHHKIAIKSKHRVI